MRKGITRGRNFRWKMRMNLRLYPLIVSHRQSIIVDQHRSLIAFSHYRLSIDCRSPPIVNHWSSLVNYHRSIAIAYYHLIGWQVTDDSDGHLDGATTTNIFFFLSLFCLFTYFLKNYFSFIKNLVFLLFPFSFSIDFLSFEHPSLE